MTYEDNWGDSYTPREQLNRESETETELAAVRREIAALRDMFAERVDAGEEAVVADNRRALQERAGCPAAPRSPTRPTPSGSSEPGSCSGVPQGNERTTQKECRHGTEHPGKSIGAT